MYKRNTIMRFIRDGRVEEFDGRYLKPLFNVHCPCPSGGLTFYHYIDDDRKCVNCGMSDIYIHGAKKDDK